MNLDDDPLTGVSGFFVWFCLFWFVVKSICFVVIFLVIVVIFEWLVVNSGVFVVKVTLGQLNR